MRTLPPRQFTEHSPPLAKEGRKRTERESLRLHSTSSRFAYFFCQCVFFSCALIINIFSHDFSHQRPFTFGLSTLYAFHHMATSSCKCIVAWVACCSCPSSVAWTDEHSALSWCSICSPRSARGDAWCRWLPRGALMPYPSAHAGRSYSETQTLFRLACYACRSQIGYTHTSMSSTGRRTAGAYLANCHTAEAPWSCPPAYLAILPAQSTKRRRKNIQNAERSGDVDVRHQSGRHRSLLLCIQRVLHANKTTLVAFIDWFLVGFGLHHWPCRGPCPAAGVVVLSLFDALTPETAAITSQLCCSTLKWLFRSNGNNHLLPSRR